MTQPPTSPPHTFRKFAPLIPLLLAAGIALSVRYWPRTHAPTGTTADSLGTKAPDFTLPDPSAPNAPPVQLSKILASSNSGGGGGVVIYFVPTYGCKKCLNFMEALSTRLPELKAAGLQFLAICPMSVDALKADFDSVGVPPIPLLSDFQDPDHFGATATNFGITSAPYGIVVLDRQGQIQFTHQENDPFDDFDKLLEIAKKLESKPSRL